MYTCKFKDEIICSFDIFNIYDKRQIKIEEVWRDAAAKNELLCEECNRPVGLWVHSDPKSIAPHFKHKHSAGGNCSADFTESKEHARGKMLLYNYFKEKYNSNVRYSFKHSNGRKSDILIEFNEGEKLAVEFQKNDLTYSNWNERHKNYVEHKINDLWFVFGNKEILDTKKYTFFKMFLLEEADRILYLLDIDYSIVTMASKLTFYDSETNILKEEELYLKEYSLYDIDILPSSKIECDFKELFDEALKEFRDKNYRIYLKQKEEELNKYQEELKKQKQEELYRKEFELKQQKEAELKKQEAIKRQNEFRAQWKAKFTDNFNSNSKSTSYLYNRKDGFYYQRAALFKKIVDAINGDEDQKQSLIDYIVKCPIDDHVLIKQLFEYLYSRGNVQAKVIFDEIMKDIGSDYELEINKVTGKVYCPQCGKVLQEKKDMIGNLTGLICIHNQRICCFMMDLN